MTYLELLQALEHRLGYQHLPLNPAAETLKQIFESSPVHHDTMRRIVKALFLSNGCRRLTDPVTAMSSFGAVGPVRQDILKTAHTDVDIIRLLDELCHALDDVFASDRAPSKTQEKRSADVIPLGTGQRRRTRS